MAIFEREILCSLTQVPPISSPWTGTSPWPAWNRSMQAREGPIHTYAGNTWNHALPQSTEKPLFIELVRDSQKVGGRWSNCCKQKGQENCACYLRESQASCFIKQGKKNEKQIWILNIEIIMYLKHSSC